MRGLKLVRAAVLVGAMLATSCATMGKPTTNVTGTYAFETDYRGGLFSRGMLTVEQHGEQWVVFLSVDRLGVLDIVSADINPPRITVIGNGPDSNYRIVARVSGQEIDGGWTYGSLSGRLEGRRN